LKTINTCLLLALLICRNIYADDSTNVEIQKISQRTWTHTSFETVNGYRTDSNGMIIDCSTELVLVDTCWNDKQTLALLKKTKELFNKQISLAIITHSHADRIGGIRALLANRIKVVSTTLTSKMAATSGYPTPLPELNQTQTNLQIGNIEIKVYFPGPGHTKDNIVVWIPTDYVLFGGCLIKSIQSNNLGNTADADLDKWGSSIQNLKNQYPLAKFVIPGHGPIGGIELLQHTIDLCAKK
jgi:metallo-beta-lactamase class B